MPSQTGPSITSLVVKLPSVCGIPATALNLYWHEAAALLRPAVGRSGGRMTLELMKAQLDARDVQLWAAFDAFNIMQGAWVSQINIYAGAKVCELLYCGGRDIQSWLDSGLNATEAWARMHGCESITIAGRKGWGRITDHRGYRHFATIFERKLDDGQTEPVESAAGGANKSDPNG